MYSKVCLVPLVFLVLSTLQPYSLTALQWELKTSSLTVEDVFTKARLFSMQADLLPFVSLG